MPKGQYLHKSPKLTPEVKQKILFARKLGAPVDVACTYAGIGRTTYKEWLLKGEKGIQPYADFHQELEQAAAQFVVGALAALHEYGAGDNGKRQSWQAYAWLLERTLPQMYSLVSRQEIQVENITVKDSLIFEATEIEKDQRLNQAHTVVRSLAPPVNGETLGEKLP